MSTSTLPGRIPEIRGYTIGTDAGVNEGNFDLVIVADFDDVDGYVVYRDHADHQAVIREHIAGAPDPEVASLASQGPPSDSFSSRVMAPPPPGSPPPGSG